MCMLRPYCAGAIFILCSSYKNVLCFSPPSNIRHRNPWGAFGKDMVNMAGGKSLIAPTQRILYHLEITLEIARRKDLLLKNWTGKPPESIFGRIDIEYEYNRKILPNDHWGRILKCIKFGEGFYRKPNYTPYCSSSPWGGTTKALLRLYCHGAFSTTATLKKHIYDEICPRIKDIRHIKCWETIFLDICQYSKISC